jgi:hypothetical protein
MNGRGEMKQKRTWQEHLQALDRRIIYLLIALAVVIPFFFPLGLPTNVTEPVRQVFDYVETLPPGSVVLISFDFGPSTMPEMYPMVRAVLRHCFVRDLVVIGVANHPDGTALGRIAMSEVAADYGKVNQEDYVYLGYMAGASAVMLAIGRDLHGVYPRDYGGVPIGEIELLEEVHTYNDIDLVVSIAATALAEFWVLYANTPYRQQVALGVTAVQALNFYPYLDTGQAIGLLGGMKGASEYEKLVNDLEEELGIAEARRRALPEARLRALERRFREASIGMDSQSIVHAAIIAFIVLGNAAFFTLRRRRRAEELAESARGKGTD